MTQKLTKTYVDALSWEGKERDVRDAQLKGFLVKVTRTAKTYYYAYLRPDRRKTRCRIGRHGEITTEQARSRAERLALEVANGGDPQESRAEAKRERAAANRRAMRAFIDGFYGEWLLQHTRSGDQTLARLLRNFEHLLDKPMDQIAPADVIGWQTRRRKAGVSAATCNRDLTALKAMLNKAVDLEIIRQNPVAGIRPQKVDRVGDARYLNQAEKSRLLAALAARDDRKRATRSSANTWRQKRSYEPMQEYRGDEYPDALSPLVILAMYTGLRRGELLSLQWCDVRLDGAPEVIVRGRNAKSSQTRAVPLHDEAVSALLAWSRARFGGDSLALVFPGKDGGRLDNFKRSWDGIRRDAKLEGFRFHDLRHHFASELVMNGVDLFKVQRLLGHSSPTMTQRYAHLDPGNLAAAVSSLSAPVNSSSKPAPSPAERSANRNRAREVDPERPDPGRNDEGHGRRAAGFQPSRALVASARHNKGEIAY